jgi:hypothetical protein
MADEETREEPTAADKLIEEVREKLAKSETKVPDPKPAVTVNPNDYRESMKKQMGWSDAQFDTYQRDKTVSQAPMVSELSKSQVREAHKDFDSLREPYEAEYKKYTDQGIAVGKELAEQIFWMVKGREVDAGRYKAPNSQPTKKPAVSSAGTSRERIAPSYNGNDPGLGGGKENDGDESGQLTDEEKKYAKIMGVDEKAYAEARKDKKEGRREITDITFRVPKLEGGAGPADRDLVSLLGQNDARRRI